MSWPPLRKASGTGTLATHDHPARLGYNALQNKSLIDINARINSWAAHPQIKTPMTREILKSREEEILAEFDALPDVDAKYMHLFQQGLDLPTLDPSLKTENNRVRGCQSDLWFHLECRDGRLYLAAESDSMVISGIAALIVRIVEGCRPEDIEDLNLVFIDRLQIWKLPSERNNSLVAMLDHLKNEARELLEAENEP